MNNAGRISVAILLLGVAAAMGCKSKDEAPAGAAGAPAQSAGDVKSVSGESAGGGIVTSATDRADAEAAAQKVMDQMESGQFAAIYDEASPEFKQIGKKDAFVAKFGQTRQKTGPLKTPQQVSFVTRPDSHHVLVYRLVNDHFVTDRRLTFARSKDGKMQLAGLNQHDEPKKK